MDRIKRLLERGYLPDQLPPPFTSAALAQHHKTLSQNWPQALHKIPSSRGELFSVARAAHARRPITIPNPINQLYLCKAISEHWRDLQQHFTKSKLSLSVPRLIGETKRATEIRPLSELSEQRLIASGSYPYALITDVSRFFPTLYTHSIPWALHGKQQSKLNTRTRNPEFFGNIIDYLVQGCQERQTIGIPIGPDTSHIISEIIATSVDLRLREQLNRWPVGYRHVDDYFICFNSRGEADAALTALRRALNEYELDINAAKTRIVETALLREDGWVERLKATHITPHEKAQKQEISRFFELAFSVYNQDENALKYALKRSSGTRIFPANWKLYEAYLLRCGLLSPNCIPTIAQILITYNNLGDYELDRERIANFCTNIIVHCTPNEHHSETAWSLFLCRELALSLPASATSALARTQSSVCALLALNLANVDLLKGDLDTATWRSALTEHGLRGPMWMLAYEATRKKWIKGADPALLQSDPFFSAMDANGVTFYDENKHVTPLIRKITKPRVPWAKQEVDEFEFDDFLDEYTA